MCLVGPTSVSEYCFTSLSAHCQSWQYRDRRKPEVGTILHSYRMTSRVLNKTDFFNTRCNFKNVQLFVTSVGHLMSIPCPYYAHTIPIPCPYHAHVMPISCMPKSCPDHAQIMPSIFVVNVFHLETIFLGADGLFSSCC